MGRISRAARLCFILLWTQADDAGRLRGHSRMLASILYPYDIDAQGLIDDWLTELEREHCILRYTNDGTDYLQICNWLKHQKIDKPSASKIPPFAEGSRALAKPREGSCEDQGSGSRIKEGIKDQGSGSTLAAQKPPDDIPDWFKDIRSLYPKRAGDQRWRKALQACQARIRDGASPSELVDGARRYAAYIRIAGKENSEYVRQAATFYSGDKAYLEPWTPAPSKAERRFDRNIETIAAFVADGEADAKH